MTVTKKHYLKKTFTVCLLILIFSLMISNCVTTKNSGMTMDVSAEKTNYQINEKTVKAMIDKAEPLIEEVTDMKFKNRMKYQIVKRNVIRDALTQELIPQLKKLLNVGNDDMLTRQAEMVAQVTSQSILGKYSLLKKEFYIVPDNVKTMVKILEIKDDQIEDFIFLVVTHEMVHALDDQHFNLKEIMKSRTNVETAGAFNALMEGHAVYVTNKIADKLKISETARQVSVKSAAGISGEANRIQQQTYHSIYIKGSEFVEAIIDKKGPTIIATAFTSPPISSRQIMNPEEYLNPTTVSNLDYSKLLKKVAEELPTEGMNSQSLDIGGMILRTLLISKGVPENEASSIADNCLGGGMTAAVKQALNNSSSVSVFILNFNNEEAVSKFDEISQKIDKSDIAQTNAKLNASYNIIKEKDLNLEGFNVARCRHAEKKLDDKVTKKINSIGIIDNMYIEVGFENMDDLTEKDMVDILNLIYTEQLKMRQEANTASL